MKRNDVFTERMKNKSKRKKTMENRKITGKFNDFTLRESNETTIESHKYTARIPHFGKPFILKAKKRTKRKERKRKKNEMLECFHACCSTLHSTAPSSIAQDMHTSAARSITYTRTLTDTYTPTPRSTTTKLNEHFHKFT